MRRCADGEPVTIQHEPTNTRDRNALLVIGSRNQVCTATDWTCTRLLRRGHHACQHPLRISLEIWKFVTAVQVLGHLAAEVSKWLGPLVVGNMVEAAGTVQDEPTSPSSPITISIQVDLSPLLGALAFTYARDGLQCIAVQRHRHGCGA